MLPLIVILAKSYAEYKFLVHKIGDSFRISHKQFLWVDDSYRLAGLQNFIVIEGSGWSQVAENHRIEIETVVKARFGRGGFDFWLKENDLLRP